MKIRCFQLLTAAHLLIGLFLFTATNGLAQSSGRKFSFGVKVGANFSQLNNLSFSTPRLTANGLPVMSGGQVVYDFFQQNDARTTGIVGGLFARFGNRLYLQPELLVSAKGGKFDVIRQGLATQSVDVKLTTVDLLLLIGVRLGPLRLNAGPMASLTVSESGNLKATVQQYTNQPISKTAKQAVFGYQAGGGITLGGLQLDLRYEGNLSDLSSVGIQTPNNDTRFSTKASLWQLTVGFGF
ncbi:PorT family protein [Spirosoma taeanense]|uniref:PorT family protein n=1 Tax=Spirosoma taeanense TaxID=2735870 RepID=A0A6M5Y8L7_9BACT|nr:outer membrane beta-barrel protein [Spirosoma taeanense]QJW90315.1 PorT family protein [Spirosoma taeanense]